MTRDPDGTTDEALAISDKSLPKSIKAIDSPGTASETASVTARRQSVKDIRKRQKELKKFLNNALSDALASIQLEKQAMDRSEAIHSKRRTPAKVIRMGMYVEFVDDDDECDADASKLELNKISTSLNADGCASLDAGASLSPSQVSTQSIATSSNSSYSTTSTTTTTTTTLSTVECPDDDSNNNNNGVSHDATTHVSKQKSSKLRRLFWRFQKGKQPRQQSKLHQPPQKPKKHLRTKQINVPTTTREGVKTESKTRKKQTNKTIAAAPSRGADTSNSNNSDCDMAVTLLNLKQRMSLQRERLRQAAARVCDNAASRYVPPPTLDVLGLSVPPVWVFAVPSDECNDDDDNKTSVWMNFESNSSLFTAALQSRIVTTSLHINVDQKGGHVLETILEDGENSQLPDDDHAEAGSSVMLEDVPTQESKNASIPEQLLITPESIDVPVPVLESATLEMHNAMTVDQTDIIMESADANNCEPCDILKIAASDEHLTAREQATPVAPVETDHASSVDATWVKQTDDSEESPPSESDASKESRPSESDDNEFDLRRDSNDHHGVVESISNDPETSISLQNNENAAFNADQLLGLLSFSAFC